MVEVEWECECGLRYTEYFSDTLCFNFLPADDKETQDIRRTESFVVACVCGQSKEIILKGTIEPAEDL